MRLVTGPRLLLLLPTLALACASPKTAGAPASEQEARTDDADDAKPKAPAEEAEEEPAGEQPEDAAAAPGGSAPPTEDAKRNSGGPSGGDSLAPQPKEAHQAEADKDAPARLDIAIPMINGGLNRDIIRRTASDHSDDVLACHGRALAAMPELAGTLVVALTIDEDGSVSEADLSDNSRYASREVEACVIALAKGWQFPRKNEETSVELAFGFNL